MDYKKWETSTLSLLCTKIGSGATPRGGKETYQEEGPYALIRSQNVLDFFFSKEGLAFINEDQAAQLNNVDVKERDVLLNITGDSVARVCQASAELLPARVNQHVSIIRPDTSKLIPEFLKYYLLNPKFKNYMLGLASVGGTRNALTKGMIEDFKVRVPPLPIQRRIAEILSALDDKIELNRQTNSTLEAMAQAIFKEWFVDFNFPGATGEMVESELGMIPKGWRVGKMGEVCELVKGVSYSSTELKPSNNALVTLKSINRGGGFNSSGFKEYSGRYKLSQCIDEGDLIFAQTDITQNADVIGSPAIVENPFEYERLIASLDIVKCIPTNEMPSSQTLFYFLQRQEFKDYCLSQTNGSTVLHLRSSEVPNYSMIIPCSSILIKFNSLAISFSQLILKNNRQNRILAELRDALLPKLMSGEIEV